MSTGKHSSTKSGRMRRATFTNVIESPLGLEEVTPIDIINGFKRADIANPLSIKCKNCENEIENRLPNEIASLFNADTEDDQFEGFLNDDDTILVN